MCVCVEGVELVKAEEVGLISGTGGHERPQRDDTPIKEEKRG